MADRPDLDLTGAAISSTFQHLLQIREDDKTLYDALGNHLDDFRLSGSFTTSEFLEIEDGQGVSGNKLHSRSGVLYWGNKNLETDEIPLLVDSAPQLGGDLDLNVGDNSFDSYLSVSPTSVEKDLFLVKSGSFSAFEVNDKGVMNLGGFTNEPDVVEGGFYYNTDENEFYLGTGE